MAKARWPVFVIALVAGCARIGVLPSDEPALFDAWQASLAASDDELSPRTRQTLRQLDLEHLYHREPGLAYGRLQALAAQEPQPDLIFALAEISYLLGRETEKYTAADACAFYYLCAGYAYHYLFDGKPELEPDVPFDPRFRLACDLYNAGLRKCIRAAQGAGRLDPGHELHLPTPDGKGFTLEVRHHDFPWKPEEFGPLLFCADYTVAGLNNQYHTYGLGVPLIGTLATADASGGHSFYPRKVSFPVSAFFRFEGSVRELTERRAGRLELYNPLAVQRVSVGERSVPLETDLTTPLAYFLSRTDLGSGEIVGFLRPAKEEARSGIYMFEPYQPGKIPVLMVHGLLSSPLTWAPMFNDLRADPVLRERFQFWFFYYPTGNSYLETAADLRDDLDRLRKTVDPQHRDPALDQMVLVGHSMGGLVSKLMIVDSGNGFWELVSKEPLDQLQIQPQTREQLRRVFYFHKRPEVARVVYLGTPHHGSKLSPSLPGKLAAHLVELPKDIQQAAQDTMQENPHAWTSKLPTSVDLLAPASAALEYLAGLPWPENMHCHSIIGQAPGASPLREVGYVLGQTDKRTDGIVPFMSAHLEQTESEIVVRADHTHVHRVPDAVGEVRRILLEHLRNLPKPASAASEERRLSSFALGAGN